MEAQPASSIRVRKSKLDGFVDLIGVLPDKEVAQRASVTPENVRTYRIRRGIPAAWRGETAADLAQKRNGSGRPARPAPPRRKPRPSKLDPYKHLLGEVPDKQVAELAEVSAENVRSYRMRRGIPATWRADSGVRINPAPPLPLAVRNATTLTARDGRWAFKVVAEKNGQRHEYVAFGGDMSEAAAGACERLAAVLPGSFLREIRVIGEAL